eukprot:2536222-Ditylum_brightwellii.AAC.1
MSMHFPLPGLGYCVLENVHQFVLHQFYLRSSIAPMWEFLQTVIYLVDVHYKGMQGHVVGLHESLVHVPGLRGVGL